MPVRTASASPNSSRPEVSATEVLKAAIARRNAVNPAINAVVESWDEEALAAADDLRGSFGGVPFLIKDMDGHLAGHRCTYSAAHSRTGSQRSSEPMVRFQMAGLNIFGKTNCPEFIMGGLEPEPWPCLQPVEPRPHPGGSSGGSAAAVARRHRAPGPWRRRRRIAAYPRLHIVGIFGLKTSRGLVRWAPTRRRRGRHGLPTADVPLWCATAPPRSTRRGSDPGAPLRRPEGPKSPRWPRHANHRNCASATSTRSIFGRKMHPGCCRRLSTRPSHGTRSRRDRVRPSRRRRQGLTIVAANVANEIDWTQEVRKPDPFERATWFLKQVGGTLTAAGCRRAPVGLAAGRQFADIFGPGVRRSPQRDGGRSPVRIGELAPSQAEQVALSVLQRVGPGPVLRKTLDDLAAIPWKPLHRPRSTTSPGSRQQASPCTSRATVSPGCPDRGGVRPGCASAAAGTQIKPSSRGSTSCRPPARCEPPVPRRRHPSASPTGAGQVKHRRTRCGPSGMLSRWATGT